MIILINTSNLYIGGGLQVALSFIDELRIMDCQHTFHIFISPVISNAINKSKYQNNFKFYIIDTSPSSLMTRNKVVAQLNIYEKKIQPDIVFSIFGPTYWRPKAKHLVGFADGWVYNPKSIAYSKLSLFERFKMRLKVLYKKYYIERDADYCVLETNDAKNKILKSINSLSINDVFVVGNTYSSIYNEKKYIDIQNKFYIKLPEREKNEYRLLYIAHAHINKNLEIIKDIIEFLEYENIKIILTIDDVSYRKIFKNKIKNIINIGPISTKSCPSIYKQCDALFAPTLLETFSASYLESMKMEKPILTSKYSFAIDICQDTALYFDPLDPEDITKVIKELIDDKKLQNKLILNGKKRIKEFETARSRAKKYIMLCEKIVNV